MQNITKVYDGGGRATACDNINFGVNFGEIHGLVGENGAGKTTLMKILYGIEKPTIGEIFLGGKAITISSPKIAIEHGIAMVQQNFALIGSLTVAENIAASAQKAGFCYNKKQALQMAQQLCEKYNLHVNVKAFAKDLSAGDKQKTELLRALAAGAKLLILDEPTAVLTPSETAELFKTLEQLKTVGMSAVFISHKTSEVLQLCDRITVLRHGKNTGVFNRSELDENTIAALIMGVPDTRTGVPDTRTGVPGIGKQTTTLHKEELVQEDEPKAIVILQNVCTRGGLADINLVLQSGKILGIAGVAGVSGREELVRLLCGRAKITAGQCQILSLENPTANTLREAGLAFVPDDVMRGALATGMTVWENLIAGVGDSAFFTKALLNKKSAHSFAQARTSAFDIRCESIFLPAGKLSGGNGQKLALARELGGSPRLAVLCEPTRGLDIASAKSAGEKIKQISANGAAVVHSSSDTDELCELCDEIIVLHSGRIVLHSTNPSNLSDEILGRYMLGIEEVRYD